MAVLSEKILSRSRAGMGRLLAVLVCFPVMLSGCVTMDSLKQDRKEKPPEGKAVQIATGWENHVSFLPDPFNGGKPTPCLTGRVYLFPGDSPKPILAEGKLSVQVFRNDIVNQAGEPVLIEQWELNYETIQQMRAKDMFGWGYSMTLPWASYHPALTNLSISVCFTPKEGFPMYSRSKVNLKTPDKQSAGGNGGVMPTGMMPK